MNPARLGVLVLVVASLACEGGGGGGGDGDAGGGGGGGDTGTALVTLLVEGPGAVDLAGGGAQVHCEAECQFTVARGSQLIATARPDAGAEFHGWSGRCNGKGACRISAEAALSLGAVFAPVPPAPPGKRTLLVQREGPGDGHVASAPGGIDCGDTCRAEYDEGTRVTLSARAAEGSRFEGWGGACSGTGTCELTLDSGQTVSARFAAVAAPPPPPEPPPPPPPPPPPVQRHTLSVERAGDGSGSVTSAPAGIDCGQTCSAAFEAGAEVTLTAVAAEGSGFEGWSGACSGTGTCSVTVAEATAVTASFGLPPPAEYQVTEIVIDGGRVYPTALADDGDVVGAWVPGELPPERGFLWDAATGTARLTPPRPPEAPGERGSPRDLRATGVSADGTRVLVTSATDPDDRALLWDGQDGLERIPLAPGSFPIAMGSAGHVIGNGTDGEGRIRGWVWDGGAQRFLAPLDGAPDSDAYAVNATGLVVGASGDAAVRYVDGAAAELPAPHRARAHGVSDTGWIAGASSIESKSGDGFVIAPAGTVRVVRPPAGYLSVQLHAVNDSGLAVGAGRHGNGRDDAIAWRAGTLLVLREVVDPGFRMDSALGVNDRGQILVRGAGEDGRPRAAVLTPR